MKRFIVCLVLSMVSVMSFAQNEDPVLKQYGRIWGYTDASGKWVIMPQWWYASAFNDGYAVVSDNGNSSFYYFIDRSGKKCFDKTFYSKDLSTAGFRNGVAKVQYIAGGTFYYLTTDGTLCSSEASAREYLTKGNVSTSFLPSNTANTWRQAISETTDGYVGVNAGVGEVSSKNDANQDTSAEKSSTCLGFFITYDYNSVLADMTDKSGGCSLGFGYKEYFHENVYAWAGIGLNMMFGKSNWEQGKDKYQTNTSSYHLQIPLSVGCSFLDRYVEFGTGPSFCFKLAENSKEKMNGKDVPKDKEMIKLEKEAWQEAKKFYMTWDINFNVFCGLKCGLRFPLMKDGGVIFSIGIGF